ncbi:hypothetical protein GCM10009838_17730 [Catenulispora subtropica]|uniref:Uncharacterized protein n=1 Tax=Catenulispora subtropica TaxID=450798 RepID=A0ABN2R0N5_9ACTN
MICGGRSAWPDPSNLTSNKPQLESVLERDAEVLRRLHEVLTEQLDDSERTALMTIIPPWTGSRRKCEGMVRRDWRATHQIPYASGGPVSERDQRLFGRAFGPGLKAASLRV